MPKSWHDRPTILGIVGDSAAGKTTLTAGIASILGKDRVAAICTDDYHCYSRTERAENGISALDPRGNYIDIMEQHLQLLRQGRPILKPVYNHDHGTLDRPEYIEPRPYIIVEGLLGYTTRAMRDCYDVKLYLDPPEDLRVRWKIQRDMAKRGYTREEVLKALEKRVNDSPAFIHPQRTFADIVVRFQPPSFDAEETGGHLDVRHMLRPTLPHPDLTPILDRGGANSGLSLQLSRDNDGKPVDVLEISGTIPSSRAEKLEELLWNLIPEASHLRANVGAFDSGQPISHPLALTQLLIAYHMVKAALGEHAV
ncbi:phosphoribulokinase [Marinivivus vitaminiproducens]|uniref:phosphoribulokinase n=1 Tax=Marinivivus vitaminiproducens TaxID=3035935 RepID=UPI0027A4EF2E|nr:phosphoribulokinase [Geminicoccaceae bacterium SCSIO 64248]